MEILVLASGSTGNAVVISSGPTSVLIDAGVSALQVRRRLESFGRGADELDGVILTHEHSDHVRGLDVLSRRHQLAVWATRGTWDGVDVRCRAGGEIASGRALRLGQLTIRPVATCHDAREPVALVVEGEGRRVGLCTDTGIMTPLLMERLRGCDALLLESNHDADMLRHGPYPWYLKQRIASRLGHLANHQSCEALDRLASGGLLAVVGMHLSEANNCPSLVLEGLGKAVGPGATVEAVTRTEMLALSLGASGVEIEKRPVPPSGRGSTAADLLQPVG